LPRTSGLPKRPVAAHVLGFASLDGIGMSGLEKIYRWPGTGGIAWCRLQSDAGNLTPITTSLDLKVTYAVRDELAKSIVKFKAKAGAAAILDVNTGEVVAMASLPDFDRTRHPIRATLTISTGCPSASMKWVQPSRPFPLRWPSIWAKSTCVRGSTPARAYAMAISPFTISMRRTGC